MSDITIISTHHSEFGKCNSDELYKIIASISPEVIFEELPNSLFDRFYKINDIPYEPPEVKCVKRYLLNNCIEHIPVDIDISSNVSSNQIEFMFNTFKKYHFYQELENEQISLTEAGFAFLNSQQYSELLDKKKTAEMDIMRSDINGYLLSGIYRLFYGQQHDTREKAMLQNIYDYSQENQYDRAVFLIGAAHRNSLMEKVPIYQNANTLNLNWTFYNC